MISEQEKASQKGGASEFSEAPQKQPNSRFCFGCGMENSIGLKLEFYNHGNGIVDAVFSVPDEYQGYPGVVHGGVLATMLDEAATRAAMGSDFDHFFVTAKLNVRYRKPVPIGEALKIVGKLKRKKGRMAVTTAEIRLPDGSIGADAEATMVDIPDPLKDHSNLDSLGWKVYLDEDAAQ
jgi:uncharacterized protein (TIGR00369 family)